MKKKTVYAVFHTTETGADYAVKTGCKDHAAASDWEHKHRDEYPRPLIIRKTTY